MLQNFAKTLSSLTFLGVRMGGRNRKWANGTAGRQTTDDGGKAESRRQTFFYGPAGQGDDHEDDGEDVEAGSKTVAEAGGGVTAGKRNAEISKLKWRKPWGGDR
jgi:hypothetical protein